MGLFSKRSKAAAASAPDAEWRSDGSGVVSNGDCGGDIQDGESFSVRYIRPDMPGSLITVTFYPVTYEELPGEWQVERQVEWMVCEDPADPGSTEIWSEESRQIVSALVSTVQSEAEREARELAELALYQGSAHGWDGQPEWGAA
jgi:hypothetical protein